MGWEVCPIQPFQTGLSVEHAKEADGDFRPQASLRALRNVIIQVT